MINCNWSLTDKRAAWGEGQDGGPTDGQIFLLITSSFGFMSDKYACKSQPWPDTVLNMHLESVEDRFVQSMLSLQSFSFETCMVCTVYSHLELVLCMGKQLLKWYSTL